MMILARHRLWILVVLGCTVFALAPMGSSRTAQQPPALLISPSGSDSRRCTQAAPCASFNRAYHVAQPGQVVEIAGGTYPAQTISRDPTKVSGKDVVFRPAPKSRVVVNGRLSFGDFDTPGPANITLSGIRPYEIRAINARDLRWVNLDARNFYLNGVQRVVIKGGDYGPCTSTVEPCGNSKIDLADPALQENRNIMIDGVVFHDYRIGAPDDHYECLIIFSGVGITVRNSKFSDCEFYDIFLPFLSADRPIADLKLEGNWFEIPWNGQGAQNRGSAVAFAPRGNSFRNIVIRNNSFVEPAGLSVNEESSEPVYANFRVLGNILRRQEKDCYPSVSQGNNVVMSGPRCDKTDRGAPFGYVVDKGKLAPVAWQAKIVQRIFSQVGNGWTVSKVARELRRNRFRTPPGTRWRADVVRRLLDDRAYLGGLYGAQGAHPRLIKPKAWAAAHRQLNAAG